MTTEHVRIVLTRVDDGRVLDDFVAVHPKAFDLVGTYLRHRISLDVAEQRGKQREAA